VIDADPESCLVKSLVENCARRQHRAIDLLHDVGGLKRRGYTETEIAKKTNLSYEYVRGVIRLLDRGEHRLLRAVESGHIPVSMAVQIAEADEVGVQRALQQAYEQNLLRGKKLILAKRLIEQRRHKGKGLRTNGPTRGRTVSSEALVQAYKDDTDRKRLLVRKADATKDRLTFVTEAVKTLFADETSSRYCALRGSTRYLVISRFASPTAREVRSWHASSHSARSR
jgi:ParB family transcriptional regulator, chromosome partitioning protein